MKILLIDDHPSFCEGLKAALAVLKRDYVVDFETGTELVPQRLVGHSGYDLYIMDLNMPGMGGVELLRYLNASHNQTPVMILSSVEDREVLREVYALGIIGFLPKSYSVYQIIDAIEECQEGNIHIPALLAAALQDESEDPAGWGAMEDVETAEGGLTRRQIEIISLMDQGLSNQEIADVLCVSKATVKTHINKLFRFFNVTNRINCLRAAKQLGNGGRVAGGKSA
jgi:DNA-binding NarL/FixJ family response regulator